MTSVRRSRDRDGAGYGDNSHRKHALVKKLAAVMVGINAKTQTERGVIVDMHAGNGNGIDLPQRDFFEQAVSEASPAIAVRLAQAATKLAVRPDVILCESQPERRAALAAAFGAEAVILSSNRKLLKRGFSHYAWALVLNDPCGHAGHAVEVLAHIGAQVPRTDYIIVSNEQSLKRHLGVKPEGDDTGSNAHLIRGCREKAALYAWQLDPRQWARRLGKRHVAWAKHTVVNRNFAGRVLLVTNHLPERIRNERLFVKE